MSALWPSMCPMGLHQDHKATHCSVGTTGNVTDCLYRRILILAGSRELAREHVIGLIIYLLENLGFVISKPKCVLELTQSIEFLGFSVNSVQQELSLPAGKVKNIRAETRHLLENHHITARKLSQLLHGQTANGNQGSTPGSSVLPQAATSTAEGVRAVITGLFSQLILSTEKEELERWLDHLSA